jgi:predicted permease
MNITTSMIQSVLVLIILIMLAYLLKRFGFIKKEHGGLFAKIVTGFTLPALIFSAVSMHKITFDYIILALIMVVAEFASALLAWGAALLLKLSRPATGALILASTFGSSAFLGYAIVKGIYPDNTEALADAAIVSELGVGVLIFTLGVFIAIHFGCTEISTADKRKTVLSFFHSPIFIALLLGLTASAITLPAKNIVIETLYKVLHIIGDANTVFVALTIGIMLNFKDFRKVILIVCIACSIKLLFQPFVAAMQVDALQMKELWKQIVVLEASMPSATMAAVFAKRYGCDAELTSILVFATFISSLLTMMTVFIFLG